MRRGAVTPGRLEKQRQVEEAEAALHHAEMLVVNGNEKAIAAVRFWRATLDKRLKR